LVNTYAGTCSPSGVVNAFIIRTLTLNSAVAGGDVLTFLMSNLNVNLIDYSGIIASLNLLTDTTDTEYDGTNPTLAGMETELNAINGEIITP